jgi:hypothetical protein
MARVSEHRHYSLANSYSTDPVALVTREREDREIDRRLLPMASVTDPTARRDALVERLFMNAIGAFDLFSVYVGDRLGLYRIIADEGPLGRVSGPTGRL